MPFVSLPGGVALFVEVFRAGNPQSSQGREERPLDSRLSEVALHDGVNHTKLDMTRPTLVVLPYFCQDVTSNGLVARDPRIRARFNVVCIDTRHQGRSKCPPRPEYDATVGAADVAFVMEALQLPPSFVYAPGCTTWQIGVKLAVLFPEAVLGLVGAGIVGLNFQPQRFTDLDSSFMTPIDEDDFDEALTEFVNYLFPDTSMADTAIVDEHIGVLVRRYGPPHGAVAYESTRTHNHPLKLTPAELARVRQPILAVVGENDLAFAPVDCQQSLDAFSSSSEKSLVIVPGGGHLVAASHAQMVTDLVFDFVNRHSSTSSRPSQFVQIDFHRALRAVAELAQDSRVLRRNVRRPESFTLLNEAEIAAVVQKTRRLQEYQFRCKTVFPGCNEPESWAFETSPTIRRRRRWRYSTRHEYRPLRPESLRRSITDSITIAVERSQAEEFDDSESGSSVPSTPTALMPIEPLSLRDKDQSKRASVPFQLFQVRI
ncbi:hypothetical protein ACM66B_002651 [Microbotryomycetes sp. NB124-2]